MPQISVTNYNSKSISFLGLGPVAPGATKSGYVPEAQYATHALAYQTRAANVGVLVQPSGAAAPTGTESFTGAGTIADDTRIVQVTGGSAYALALPSAADVADGTTMFLSYSSGANPVALTPATGETTGTDAVTYDLAATAADNTGTGFVITLTNTITRNDAGSWITEGYLQGGRIVIADAEDAGNNGTFVIATVSASVITVTGTLTNNADDTAVHFGVDNRIRLSASNELVRLVSDGVSNWALG